MKYSTCENSSSFVYKLRILNLTTPAGSGSKASWLTPKCITLISVHIVLGTVTHSSMERLSLGYQVIVVHIVVDMFLLLVVMFLLLVCSCLW